MGTTRAVTPTVNPGRARARRTPAPVPDMTAKLVVPTQGSQLVNAGVWGGEDGSKLCRIGARGLELVVGTAAARGTQDQIARKSVA